MTSPCTLPIGLPRAYAWKSLAIARAIENQSYVITVNRIGEDTNGNQYGDSQVINSMDKYCIIWMTRHVKTITLEKSLLVKHRLDFPVGWMQISLNCILKIVHIRESH